MPIYEFRCNSCNAVTNVFVRSFSSPLSPVCTRCGSLDLARLISRPFLMKSTIDRMEDFDVGRSLSRLEDPNDPSSVARWARQVSGELGDELGEELREMAESVESDQDTFDPGEDYTSADSREPQPDDPPFPMGLT